MSLHEELEKCLRSKYPVGTNFKELCGAFGENLVPPVSGSTVKRWCKGTHVPKQYYTPQILKTTGLDFSETERPPKLLGIKPLNRATLPVDFKDLQWVYSETPCVGCFIDGGSDECENAVRAITGLKCKSRNFVLKRKPTWEVCTKQNTKVGDVVRCATGRKSLWDVQYIMHGIGEAEMVVRSSDTNLDSIQKMKYYEVEI